ncbi:hypothetical protein [Lonsdalea quercina]
MARGFRPQGYVHNPLEWVDPLGLSSGKVLIHIPDIYLVIKMAM